MATAIINPFDYFSDRKGRALDEGYIYIGVANQDPESFPQACFWDDGLTIPAAQPLRTIGGYVVNPNAGNSPAVPYTASAFSIRVRDKQNTQVSYSPEVIDDEGKALAAIAASSGSSLVGFLQAGVGAQPQTVQEELRNVLSIQSFATPGGVADATAGVVNAIALAIATGNMLDGHGATFRLTSKINIPLIGPLRMRNVTFLVDHAGVGIGQATAGGGANVVARGYFENIRVLAAQNATIAWDAVTFQYCQWINCFVGSAGGKFARAWKLSNVSYWNTFYSPEVEAVSSYAWDLSDANDTRFFMPRHVDFSGTPLSSVIFSGACSGIDFFGISFETAFTSTNGAVDFAAACEQIRFFGGRIERRSPGTTATAIRLNGSTSCILDGIYILGGFTNATDAVGNNFANLFSSGFSATRMGGGQFFVNTNTSNADTPGGMIYNTLRERFTGYAAGARDFAMSPSADDLNMNGHVIDNAARVVMNAAATAPGVGKVALGGTVTTTVGVAGGASALPATPLGYLIAFVENTQVRIPYYLA